MTDLSVSLALATPLFFMVLALFVFMVRPEGAVNRVAAAFLVLTGAADLMWFFVWHGEFVRAHGMARAGMWYDIPRHFLALWLLHVLYPAKRPGLWRGIALGAAGMATLGLLVTYALEPGLLVAGVQVEGDVNEPLWGPAWGALAFVAWGVLAITVGVSARVASSPARSVVEREQAGVVGSAFLLITLYSGFQLSGNLTRMVMGTPLDGGRVFNVVSGFVLVGVCLWALPRLVSSLERRTRYAVLALVGVAGVMGLMDHGFIVMNSLWDLRPIPVWDARRRLFAMVSAALLAVAFIRFDLAGSGPQAVRRMTWIAHVSLLLVALLFPAVVVLTVLSEGYVVMAGAVILVAVGTTFAPVPLHAVRSLVSRLFMVDPEGHAATGERARRYRLALEHRMEQSGRVPDPADPALSHLRGELGLVDDDHVRIAHGVEHGFAPGTGRSMLLGRYRVLEELGRGAFAVALLAEDEATGRVVVLKRYHRRDVKEQALAEARLLAQVEHPRIVPLLAVEQTHDETFLVLAHAEGGSLKDRLDREGPVSSSRATRWVRDLLDALGALHAAGLAHRDVKPENLLLDGDDQLGLGDLGATGTLVREDRQGTLTVNPMIGSYATVAPEMLRGQRAEAAADVYSAGAVLYKLLTGEDYVDLDPGTPVQLMSAVLHAPVRLPHPRVPSWLEAVIRPALEKDPDDRFRGAGAMARALEEALGPVDR